MEEEGKLKCDHHDVEVVEEIAQALMLSLACACKEKTYGSLFSSPIAPAEGLKREMVEFLHRKCEADELDTGRSSLASPFSMVRYLLDEFVGSKKSFLNKVSSKGPKEDGAEALVAELERTGVWPLMERETIARDLLHALYPKGSYHCEAQFDSETALSEHVGKCPIRPVPCPNGQCKVVVSAGRLAAHDAKCPSKPLLCEQGCDGLVGRADMARHCASDCPMKRVDCPFCHVGCAVVLPQHLVNKHCNENANAHLLQMLQAFQRQEVSLTKLSQRLSKAEKSLSVTQKAETDDTNAHMVMFQEQEAKIKALEGEAGKFRKSLSSTSSREVLQLQRDVQNLQSQVEALRSNP